MTNTPPRPLVPGATIGILGGGQLGRMLSVAASRLGFKTCIFDPAGDCPASHVANYHFQKTYDDNAALRQFSESCDVITYEFENIPDSVFDETAPTPIFPNRTALSTAQNRIFEKEALQKIGLNLAPFCAVTSQAELQEAITQIGTPSILKTQTLGYDGKGQIRISDGDDLTQIWARMNNTPCVLEGFIAFSHEVSVIGARGADGQVACYDPGENLHRDGILRKTTVPARLSHAQRTDAVVIASQIMNALDYVGVIGVEMFVTPDGLLVNEIAPRVHNSGHWTQNGCAIDQFEQHIRAIAGWPLGDGARHSDVEMENLIGDDMERLDDLSRDAKCSLHLYGKAETRDGRKMGHINRVL